MAHESSMEMMDKVLTLVLVCLSDWDIVTERKSLRPVVMAGETTKVSKEMESIYPTVLSFRSLLP